MVSSTKVRSLVRRILETQRKSLSDIIAEQQDTKKDLLEGVASWLPRWKQWGVDLEVSAQDDKIQMASKLLKVLRESEIEDAIVNALQPHRDGDVTHFNFMSVLTSDHFREAELDALESKAMDEDLQEELASAVEPLLTAEITEAEDAAARAQEAAELALQAAAEAKAKADLAKKQAEEISSIAHKHDDNEGEEKEEEEDDDEPSAAVRETTSEPGDEDLDFMDLLASLDLMDYSEILCVGDLVAMQQHAKGTHRPCSCVCVCVYVCVCVCVCFRSSLLTSCIRSVWHTRRVQARRANRHGGGLEVAVQGRPTVNGLQRWRWQQVVQVGKEAPRPRLGLMNELAASSSWWAVGARTNDNMMMMMMMMMMMIMRWCATTQTTCSNVTHQCHSRRGHYQWFGGERCI